MTPVEKIKSISLKNKIFFSITIVILLISVLIALFTRWVLISSLTSELKRRGLGIGNSVAERSRSHILTENLPRLTSLAFDTRLGDRRQLVVYLFIQNKADRVLAHTFTQPFPERLKDANPLPPDSAHRIRLIHLAGKAVYDVAVPVQEGLYRVGTVHLGVDKNHIDQLIGKLRTTFVGFVTVVTLFFFIISHALARYITQPISRLTRVSDEISRGNFEVSTPVPQTMQAGDEVGQLTSSFINMARRIKQSQARLQESETKYRSLFNAGPNPIFVLDRQGQGILDANPRAQAVFGYTIDELRGRPFSQLGPLDTTARPDMSGGTPEMVISKAQYCRKDGSPVHVNVHAIPARYGQMEALIVATTDISEMVEKDSQLIQASKMTTLGEMSAGIAHEVHQPLNAIKMGSDYLEFMTTAGKPIPPADLTGVAAEISGQVDRAVAIIRRLRDFGRKSDFSRDRVQLNECVLNVVAIIGRQLTLQDIRLQLHLDDNLPVLMAHANRLEQVIFNLLTNARDAINQRQEDRRDTTSHRIQVTTKCEKEKIGLIVTDSGVGIPENVKPRIFEAFFTTKQMGEGMGLGLSITNEIIEDYGGNVSIGPGIDGGTTFTITFPAAP